MNKAVKKYLRQVKKHLCCPRSHSRDFLRQLEDDMLLFCEEQDTADLLQLTAQFGHPKDVAEDFCAALDPRTVTRAAFTRLKFAYLALAVILVLALSFVMLQAVDCCKTQQLVSGARAGDVFIHPNGTECATFWVRTNYQGRDLYWEYHSCTGRMLLILPPAEADGTEPYATDIYLNANGTIEHWTFGQEHECWIRVYDDAV